MNGRWSGNRGFTLAEVLVASGIAVTVLGLVVAVFVASQRGLQSAMAQIQTAVELRTLREKLLFRVDGDGWLMSARYSTIMVDGGAEGWGGGLSYVPFEGAAANVVSLAGDVKKLHAEREFAPRWLAGGQITFATDSPFRASIADGEIHVAADVRMQAGDRVFGQRQLIRAQIMAQ